ncbi:MAG: DNA modification methylase [Euryarchaeota archaeon CG01_land_8_20_14_3_00_38_12]|nr:MAG: DNA modification methylase [Euryarchaeota archaeon CG01_land_8_20_14_3_00_38_12]PJB21975.1 MAG: DNA modification methylase [Euryarchaeota archaeon CG_4_9_14_3_um_filter_38_12]
MTNTKRDISHISCEIEDRINYQSNLLTFEKELINNKNKIILNDTIPEDASGSFVKNMSLPIHRWFRYSAGFSAEWVESIITKYQIDGELNVFDPFVGSGTVLIACEHCGANGLGIDSHPFISRISHAKLQWRTNVKEFINFATQVKRKAQTIHGKLDDYPEIIKKCYPSEILIKLDSLKKGLELHSDNSPQSELTWLALASILRITSPVGTSNMELIQPKKQKKIYLEPFQAFSKQINDMADDMIKMQTEARGPKAIIYQDDARTCLKVENNWANLVITSPPYVNNFDYADATRLEMSFFKEIDNYGDLQKKVRVHLMRSCTQHVSNTDDWRNLIDDIILKPIKDELIEICNTLEKERLNHGGKKNYHIMVASYFYDIAHVWQSLRRICKSDSNVCFVIGDSAPYGIYIPVEKWLGELAINSGFKNYTFEKTRDRNIKWKNRKHKVLLHEGFLWVKG